MHQKKWNIIRGHTVILSSLALITAFFSFLVISVEAGWNDCAIDWNKFSTNPGFIADYTYKGQSIRDHESTGSGDPSHGPANVPPAETDLASGAGATNPGPYTTPFFGYYDGGTPYDPGNPSTMNDDFILFRMRIEGDPRHGGEFASKHWNVLLDVDADGYKEYWVDLQGDYSQNSYDRLNILYDNINSQIIADPDRTNPLVRVDYFTAYNSPDTNSPCTTYGLSHTRTYAINDGTGDWYIEEQIPMTAFKDSNGNQVLYPDSPVAFVFSTGASNNDPLQKDWMMDLHYLSDADPITFGDIILPNGNPIIDFTNSSLDPVSFYTIGNNIYVYVKDPRANTTSGIDTITVTVTDTTTGDDEVLTLVETGARTGIFTNTGGVGTQLTSSASNGIFNDSDGNHNLEVVSGDSIYVSYTNPGAFTVTDHAAIIGPCEVFMEFTRANGLPSNSFILTNNINTSDKVYLTVTNPAANTNINTIQSITVNLSGNDAYTMTLTETGINTGVFRNTTGLNTLIESLPVDMGDNTWEDVDGGIVTANYNYNVGGCSGTKTTTATLFVTANGGRVYFTNSSGTQDVELYGPGQQVYLKVNDASNCGTGTPKTLSVTVSSAAGDSDTVTLTETSTGSGIFRNTADPLTTATFDGSYTANDGIIEAANGDTLTVTYTDCNDGDSDSANNNKTDTAKYNAPNLVINEVLFWPNNIPLADPPPNPLICQTEYIMLYNPTPGAINVNGYHVTDGDNFNYYLPNITLTPYDKAYISLYASGQTYLLDQYDSANKTWYLFSTTSPIFPSNELGDPNLKICSLSHIYCTADADCTGGGGICVSNTDPSDQVLLYNNLNQIIDYVAWSSTVTPSVDFQGDDSPAVAAGIWQDDAFVNVSGMSIGYAITRSTIGFDSNTPNDWKLTTNQALDVCNSPVITYALISSFDAYMVNGSVTVQWETTTEVGALGFYLLRLNKKTGAYGPVNSMLFPALIDSPQGGTYSVIDSGASLNESNTYKLVEVEFAGRQHIYGPYTVSVKDGSVLADSRLRSSVLNHGNPLSIYSRKAGEISKEKILRLEAVKEQNAVTVETAKNRKGNSAKLSIADNGLYYMAASEISALLNVSSKDVMNRIKTNRLKLSVMGNAIPYIAAGNNAGIYFYGKEIDSIYTKENIYRIEKNNGLQMVTLSGTGPQPAEGNESFTDTHHFEENAFDATSLFSDPTVDYWFWDYIVSGDASLGAKTFPIQVSDVAAAATNASLKVNLQGGTITDNHVVVTLNGEKIGEETWYGAVAHTLDLSFKQDILKNGENIVGITGLLDTGAPYDIFYLNFFDLTYQKLYHAVGNTLLCRGDGNAVITVTGFTHSDISVFDVTDPEKPILNNAATIDGTDGNYRISFVPDSPGALYLVASYSAPLRVTKALTDVQSKLKNTGNSADYLIITNEALSSTAQSLVKYRKSQKLKGMTVLVEDIMDEFNYGMSSPEAIKAFLSYAYHSWKKSPRYVVLIGKGSYDYKDYLGFADNIVPPAMVGTPQGLFPSDNYFADMNGDHIPDMSIGRLPVVTSGELQGFINKIIAFEKSKSGDWKSRVLMSADYPENGETFPADSDAVAALIPQGYNVGKIYLSNLSLQEARRLLLEGVNNGTILLNYIGHAGVDRLSKDGLLVSGDVATMTNMEKLPVVTTMTCVTGIFSIPGVDCLGEALVLKGNGGAAAFLAPTGLSINSSARVFDEEFVKAYLQPGKLILGDVVLKTFLNYSGKDGYDYMLDIYNIMGDPATRLK